MSNVILHIPHSSVFIPFYDGYIVTKEEIEAEQLILTDWYTDDLFQFESAIPVVAPFSRLFCDPERFEDDSLEIMAAVGMGVLYEKKVNGERLRVVDDDLRERIITAYYRVHHQNFSDAVNKQLKEYRNVLIIDCHSFPSQPRDLNKYVPYPDYNIGTDPFHTPQGLLEQAKQFFKQQNLSLGIDHPYSGSIVPAEHYRKDKKVQTIMLEVNRALYLEDGTAIKNKNYEDVKKTIKGFIRCLIEYFNILQHQEMLSALVTKGYNNLSEAERRYWNSVY